MTKRNEIYKCEICGNITEVLIAGGGELVCCGQPMKHLEEMTEDTGNEKHVPVVEKIEGEIDIIADNIDIVIPLPGGAHPTSCYPLYPIDGKEILRYITYCTQGQLNEYLEELSFTPVNLR